MRYRLGQNASRVSWRQVAAFRLSRHHLSKRAPAAAITSVAAEMAGAQAQVLSAAQMSIWARARIASIQDLDAAIWKERTLVRAWCMRRTMFLLPSDELALFVRGTARRSEYNLRWAVERVGSREQLDMLLEGVMDILKQPRTRSDLAGLLNKSFGYKLKFKAGGGWGDKRPVPWVEVGDASLSVGFLLHIIGARDVICSGPNVGNESTFVRADRWLPHWKDIPQERAEEELLVKYLRAFGPSTVTDFALWVGLYVRDVKELWSRVAKRIAQVDVEGWKAGVLQSDLPLLEKAEIDHPAVRLLPNFDTYLLGHRSHRNVIDEANQKKIYRSQGWVSPVLLVDGRAQGVWSYKQRKNELEVRVTPFSKLSGSVSSKLREEASDLGRFLGYPSVKTIIA